MKQFIKNILLVAGSVFTISVSFAQDVHFSHMEFSPLTLNPALAGANSPMQGIVNYRSQWNSVATPYQTIAASFDARFNENKRNRSGIIAGGINFYNDQAGDLKVNTSSASLNLAYHLILDRSSTIGIALNGGYGQRSINTNGGRWGSQYNGLNYDASINPSEVLNNSSFNYLDAGAGLLYTYGSGVGFMNQNISRKLNAGFAVYHINRPNYSYSETENERLHMRISVFVNAEIGITNTRGSILPGIYYQRQKTAQEVYFGANYKYNLHEGSLHTGFTKPLAIYIGIFARYRDALVGKVMFEYDQFSAGFGYDINVSSLSTVSRTRGGFELFLRFNTGDGGGFRSRI